MSYATVLEAVRIAGLNNKAAGEVFSYLAVNGGTAAQLQSALQQMGVCWAGGAERLSWDIANSAGYAEIRAALVSCGAAHDAAAELLAYELSQIGPTDVVWTSTPSLWYSANDVNLAFNAGIANNDPQALWKNKGSLGAGWDAPQAVAGSKPLFKSTAIPGKMNSKPGVLFDGVDDYMLSSVNAPQAQPSTWCAVVRQETNVTGVFSSGSAANRQQLFTVFGAGLEYFMFASGSATTGKFLTLQTFHALTGVFNGVSSVGGLDGALSAAINPGANTIDQIGLGAGPAYPAAPANFYLMQIAAWFGGGQPTHAQLNASVAAYYGATPQ